MGMGRRTGVNKDAAYEEIDVKININSTLERAGSNGPDDGRTLRRHLGVSSVVGTIYFNAYAVYLPFPMDNTRATNCEGAIYVDHGWMVMHLMDLAMIPMTEAHPAFSKPLHAQGRRPAKRGERLLDVAL